MKTQTTFRSLLDLMQRFPTEKFCHEYFAAQRWGGYMVCPYDDCENDKAYVFKDGIRYKCTCCKRIYTAKTNSFMEGSKLPSIKWILAMYLILHKKGISSVQLSKDLGITQKSAWFVLQRIRWAFGNEEQPKMEGIVQMDESFVGGKNKNRHADKKFNYVKKSKNFPDKIPVFGMLEQGGKVRAMTIAATSKKEIRPLIYKHVHMGSTIVSDEFNVYKYMDNDYHVKMCNHSKKRWNVDGACTNGMENFWSHMKRCFIGVYISISPKHLNKYVQEAVFRHNYRNLDTEGQFGQIMNNMECRLKYKDLIA